ncbi:hypothetical protein F4821DRAFT_259415 [Hypoxylon rubiginosum]|uniref:Uncharacterized protein n=1 Tax=Hypoxylon rubiginosum TaxID=110542 RepID=A0ACC0D2M1_9PEZI|nr:hypothetical protein F4821DRAFT_259415 [Hypoxylon rubiginosum]
MERQASRATMYSRVSRKNHDKGPRPKGMKELRFTIELLEATIPIIPNERCPATSITLRKRWEPAESVLVKVEHGIENNAVSCQWLEKHVSHQWQSTLHEKWTSQNVLLVWRFFRGYRKFQTAHQIVDTHEAYTMTFSSNRPKFLPNTASLFEELVEQAQFPSTDSKTKKIARWKDWVLPRLYRCLHGVGRPSKPGAASIDDGITPLGDLSRPEEDTDWVYVTLLDIEPSYEEDMELGELHQRIKRPRYDLPLLWMETKRRAPRTVQLGGYQSYAMRAIGPSPNIQTNLYHGAQDNMQDRSTNVPHQLYRTHQKHYIALYPQAPSSMPK